MIEFRKDKSDELLGEILKEKWIDVPADFSVNVLKLVQQEKIHQALAKALLIERIINFVILPLLAIGILAFFNFYAFDETFTLLQQWWREISSFAGNIPTNFLWLLTIGAAATYAVYVLLDSLLTE